MERHKRGSIHLSNLKMTRVAGTCKGIRLSHKEATPSLFGTRDDFMGGFPCGSGVKNPPAKAGATGDACSIPGLGRSPGEGMARLVFLSGGSRGQRAWWAIVNVVAKSQTRLKRQSPGTDFMKDNFSLNWD